MTIAHHAIVALLWLLHTSSFLHSNHFPANSQKTRAGQLACQRIVPARRKRYDDNDIDFGPLLRRCRSENDFQPAIDLAEKALLLRPMPPSILTGVIKVFGEAGQLGRAVSLLKVMREEMNVVPNEYHLGALIAACRRCGQWEMGVALYNRMDSLQVKKNTVICNNIISTLGDALQWGSVFEILKEMETLDIKKDIVTYSSSITACVKAGEWERATTLYRMMEEEGIKPNTITLNAVLNACARGRQVRLALDLFSEACKSGIQVDAISYSVVIKVCGDINEFNVALALFNAMGEGDGPDDGKPMNSRKFTSDTWNSSSSSQFSGEYVKEIINSCKQVPRDTGCYNSMITCCERAGKWEIVVDILNCMLKLKAARSNARPDCKTFSAAISCCGKQGRWKEACDIFDLMAVEGVKKDTAVYNAIIAALQLAAQRQATEEMKNRDGGIISDTGAVTGISSADLLEKAQLIYAEGLKDGQLQHYAYDSLDAPNNKGQKKAFISPTNLFPVSEMLTVAGATGYSLPLPNIVPSSRPASQPVAVVVDEASGTDAETIMINLNQFANGLPARPLHMNSRDEVAVLLPLGFSLPPPLPLPLGLPIAQRITFDNSTSASIQSQVLSQSQSSISNTKSTWPRILDLHKCPLLIAEAAIDYEMKLIYDECVTEGAAYENDIGTNMPTDRYAEHMSSSNSGSSSTSSSSDGSSTSSSSSSSTSTSRSRSRSSDGSSCFNKGDLALEPLQVSRSRRSSRHNRKKIPSLVPSEYPLSPTPPPLPHPSHALDIPAAPLVDSWKPKTCAFDLHIVTGRGRHINSSGTRGVLRLNIKDYLLDTYDIVADRISGNDGCIIVTSSSINRWISRMQSLSENAP